MAGVGKSQREKEAPSLSLPLTCVQTGDNTAEVLIMHRWPTLETKESQEDRTGLVGQGSSPREAQ